MIIMVISQVLVRGQARPNEKQSAQSLPPIGPTDVNDKEDELGKLQDELMKVRNQWGVLEADYPGHQNQVNKLTEDIRLLRQLMADDANIPGKVASARAEKTKLDSRQKELLKQIEEERSKSTELQKQIDTKPKVTEVALTETRIVPTELKAVEFVCRYGRIYRIDFNEIGQAIEDALEKVSNSITSSMSQSARVDKFVNYFKENDVGNSLIKIKVTSTRFGTYTGFVFTYEPRSKMQGETLEEMLLIGSKFRSAVSGIDPDKEYIRFSVWSDSFDTYIAAQQAAADIHKVESQYQTKIGMSWTAYDFDEELKESWIPGIRQSSDPSRTTIKNTM